MFLGLSVVVIGLCRLFVVVRLSFSGLNMFECWLSVVVCSSNLLFRVLACVALRCYLLFARIWSVD